MSRIFSIIALILATSACFERRDDAGWDLSQVSQTCRSTMQTKSLFLKLNLCKQEAKMQIKLNQCLNETWTSWRAQSEICQAESASTALSASSYFLNQALGEYAAQPNIAAQEQLDGQLRALELWISSLPSQLKLEEFESLFQKIYIQISKQSLALSFDESAGDETEATQVRSARRLLEAFLRQKDAGFYTDLLLVQGLSDLLTAIEPKISLLLKVRELSCAFDHCSKSETNLAEFLALVAQLRGADIRLSESLPSEGSYGQAVQTLRSGRERLKLAVERYEGQISSSSARDLNVFQERLQKSRLYDLLQAFKRFEVYQTALQSTDVTGSEARQLRYGLSRESSENIANYLLEVSRSLQGLGSNYKNLSREARQNLKENLNNQVGLNSILLDQSLELQNIQRLENEILGLSNAYLEADQAYARFQAKFNRLSLTSEALGSMWSSSPAFEGLSVSGADAKFEPGSTSLELGDLAVRVIELSAGEALNLEVRGEWGPSCAVSRYSQDLGPGQLVTGPGGYLLTLSDGKTELKSRETYLRFEQTTGRTSRSSLCGNFSLSTSINASACKEIFTGKSTASGSNSSERSDKFRSNSLNLQAGLTLPGTPFPELPAGALIAVSRSAEGSRYQVLNRITRIEAVKASRVYLIVNDCREQLAGDAGSLTVDAFKLEPTDAVVRRDLALASERLEQLYQDAAKIFASGTDIDGELQLKAQEARSEIYRQTSAFTRFDLARQYLEQLILHRTQQLQRRAKIIDRNYRLSAERARFQSSARAGQFNMNQSDLLVLEAKKIAEDLTLASVGPRLNDVSQEIIDQILPVVFFQAERSDLRPFIASSLRELQASIRLDVDLGKLTEGVANLSRDLALALSQTKQFVRYRNQYDDVLIAVPRPELPLEKTLKQGTPTLQGRSQLALWQALFGTGDQDLNQVVFQLAAQDVYGDRYASGSISCNSRQAVIEDVALAFVTDQTDRSRDDLRLKSRNLDLPLRIGPGFVFPTARGPLEFKVLDPSEGVSNARFGLVRKDAYEDAYDLLRNPSDLNGAGKGLSPFGDWSFKPDALRAFVRANAELFYRNPAAGALLAAESLPESVNQDLGDFFTDDFADFEMQPSGPEASQLASLEKFPEQITDILILIRFSSLTSTDPSLMSWIESCR